MGHRSFSPPHDSGFARAASGLLPPRRLRLYRFRMSNGAIEMKAQSVRAWFAAIVVLLIGGTASQAEDIEITHCYSGVYSAFNRTEGTSVLGSWSQNGIVM